jgi:ribosomal protein S18 acetylase RimI-like enzyme/predicted GNAT family acetyltransferase
MSLEINPMLDYDMETSAAVLNRGFEGYFVKLEFSPTSLANMVAQDGIRIADSRIVRRGDRDVAIALIARRGWSSRLAGMAVIPEARGTGIGGRLTAVLLEESRARGEHRMELEVIEENATAVRLYERNGFGTIRRLVSFALSPTGGTGGDAKRKDGGVDSTQAFRQGRGAQGPREGGGRPREDDRGTTDGAGETNEGSKGSHNPGRESRGGSVGAPAEHGADLDEVDVLEVARRVTRYGLPDLPWQVSGETVANLGPPHRAYKLGAAYAVLTDPTAATVMIRSLVVEPAGREKGRAAALLGALMAEFPGKEWRVPALCPEEIGGVFESVGFIREKLAQFHMVNSWK